MKYLFNIIKADYLQRTRSYAFLITACASLALGYSFIPEPNANYSTIRIGDYIGHYNSAWIGYVSATMTSIFLSLLGFYLVNSGIKKDIDTRVGQIIASTPTSNFNYLLSKVLSNFLVLLTIVGIVFMMSIFLFLFYNEGFSFELIHFIKPYAFLTIPAIFVISVLAVLFEVCLGRYSVLQNIGFFFLFSFMAFNSSISEPPFLFDVFGSKTVMHQLESTVKEYTGATSTSQLSIGYNIGNTTPTKRFHFEGMDFPVSFIMSRLIFMGLGIALIALISLYFHRFRGQKRSSKPTPITVPKSLSAVKDLQLMKLSKIQVNYSRLPLIKTELILLIRKGKKWLWIINLIGIVLLVVLPMLIALQIMLPVLWFLQVHRLSNMTTKELSNRVHYFAFTSYQPLRRLLISQLCAGMLLMLCLALPLLTRLAMDQQVFTIITVVFGGVFMVTLAAFLGMLSKGKKLFEVLFFLITYANINGIQFVDYFGGFEHQPFYLTKLILLTLVLGSLSFVLRRFQIKQ